MLEVIVYKNNKKKDQHTVINAKTKRSMGDYDSVYLFLATKTKYKGKEAWSGHVAKTNQDTIHYYNRTNKTLYDIKLCNKINDKSIFKCIKLFDNNNPLFESVVHSSDAWWVLEDLKEYEKSSFWYDADEDYEPEYEDDEDNYWDDDY
jgi:hypothetical protein